MAKTAASNQIKSILVLAPEPVRAKFAGLTTDQLVTALAGSRDLYADPVVADTIVALRILAQRHRDLTAQIEWLTARIEPQVPRSIPR